MTDGPFVESKEIVGGYSIVQADTIDAAAELAKGCPALLSGGKVEVRPLAGLAAALRPRRAAPLLDGGQPMSTAQPEPVAPLVEHFFRREAGRLVAVLTRFFGWRNFDLVEEMVQATLLDALQSWRVRGIPDNPSAWIHRVAKNKILDSLGAPKSAPGDEDWSQRVARTTRESTSSFSTPRSKTASFG